MPTFVRSYYSCLPAAITILPALLVAALAPSLFSVILTFHVSLCIAAAVFLRRELRREKPAVFPVSCAALTASAGIAGLAVSVLALLARTCAGDRTGDLDWLLAPNDNGDGNGSELVRRLARLGINVRTREFPSVPIKPFYDLVRWGSLAEKQRVLGQIGKYFDGRFLPALQSALSDSDNLVRVQAASTMVAVESRLAENIAKTESKALKDPSDFEALKKLTLARVERLQSGLDSEETARAESEECSMVMLDLHQMGMLETDEISALIRLLVDCGRYGEARRLLRAQRFDPSEHRAMNEQVLVASRRFRALVRYRTFRARYEHLPFQ